MHSGDPCQSLNYCANVCNETLRSCSFRKNGTQCNDNLFCNGNDTCDGLGNCMFHTGDPCKVTGSPSDLICAGACEESIDKCVFPYLIPCNDTIFCNGQDMCDGVGKCSRHSGDPCFQANNPCRPAGICTEVSQTCQFPGRVSCSDGIFCNGGDLCDGYGGCTIHLGSPCSGICSACNETQSICMKFQSGVKGPCPTCYECDGNGNCSPSANGTDCNDGIYCNGADKCNGNGVCVHLGNPCPVCHNCSESLYGHCVASPKGTICNDLMYLYLETKSMFIGSVTEMILVTESELALFTQEILVVNV
jgi:hypothetical protein